MPSMDHPRMCGEKILEVRRGNTVNGSPPHVRGKVCKGVISRESKRITPACAGKSITGDASVQGGEDHPRMCGEKRGHESTADRKGGSPPHVRGKDFR